MRVDSEVEAALHRQLHWTKPQSDDRFRVVPCGNTLNEALPGSTMSRHACLCGRGLPTRFHRRRVTRVTREAEPAWILDSMYPTS